MKVKAKHQIAYKNTSYKAGDTFEINTNDLEDYKNDVEEVKEKKASSPRNKKAKKTKNK